MRYFPYDPLLVTEAQYLATLEDMIDCLTTRDPGVTASTVQALDYITYDWHKEPDENGFTSVPALSECAELHMQPLELIP